VVRTASRDDRWLSVGHGRLVDTPDGRWYMAVHAYESGYRALGIEVTPGCASGLLLFYNPEHATGILLDDAGIGVRIANGYVPSRAHQGATRAQFRLVNDRQEIDFYYRVPGDAWRRAEGSAEIAGMDHNVLGGFLDVRPAVFAAGSGHATFRNFRYWREVKSPV
jgi:xylan 1,4-beta-xylosidase